MASWRGAAAAQQIKYSDTGLLPEALIELPAMPDEITGRAAGTADEKMCQQLSLHPGRLVVVGLGVGGAQSGGGHGSAPLPGLPWGSPRGGKRQLLAPRVRSHFRPADLVCRCTS